MSEQPEPGDLSREFDRVAGDSPSEPPEVPDLTATFNHAVEQPRTRSDKPELRLTLEPHPQQTGIKAPGLGTSSQPPAMTLEEQRASRQEEMGRSLKRDFNRASVHKEKTPELGR